jgi:hypothetical protein
MAAHHDGLDAAFDVRGFLEVADRLHGGWGRLRVDCEAETPRNPDQGLSSNRIQPEEVMKRPTSPILFVAAAAALLIVLAGCASTRVDAQWKDPQARSFKGATVLVVCEAYETTVRRLCQDQLVAEVKATGAKPVVAADAPMANPYRPTPPAQWVSAARSAGASAILSVAVEPGPVVTRPGVSIGVGLGGGFGGGGFGGVGVSAPVGPGQSMTGYLVDAQIADANDGKSLWSAKINVEGSTDVNGQMRDLARSVTGAAQKAGLL